MEPTAIPPVAASITNLLTTLVADAMTTTGGVFILAAMMLIGFMRLAPKLTRDSAFAGAALPLVCMALMLPTIMYLGVTKVIETNAVTAMLGVVIGYVFNWRSSASEPTPPQSHAAPRTPPESP